MGIPYAPSKGMKVAVVWVVVTRVNVEPPVGTIWGSSSIVAIILPTAKNSTWRGFK